MVSLIKKLVCTLLFIACLIFSACKSTASSEDENSTTTSKGTKSATITISETALQSSRSEISTTDTGDYLLSNQAIDTTARISITLYNSGDVAAEKIKAYSLSSPLAYSGGSYPGTGGTCTKKIEGGTTCTIVLAFTPTQIGENLEKLQIGYYNGRVTRTFEKVFKATAYSVPTISYLTPSYGKITGGNSIVVTGTQLFAGAVVTVDGSGCAVLYSNPPTSLTCLAPPHSAGSATLTVSNSDGKTATSTLTYVPPPTATAVSPSAGGLAGGTTLTITGTSFVNGTTVSVGGSSCNNVSVASSTSLTCTTSSHTAATVDIVVTNPDTSTGTGSALYTYQPAPTISSISPSIGNPGGGEYLTITGTNFLSGVAVTIGGTACVSLTRQSSTSLLCVAPSGTANSAADISVINTDNQQGELISGYSYVTGESWTQVTTSNIPIHASGAMVWTGAKVLLYGGSDYNAYSNSGALYDPVTNSSTAISSSGAPTPAQGTPGVWTGSKFLTWGGFAGGSFLNQGGVYDPNTDTWTLMTTNGAPTGRNKGVLVWTGKKMIAWSGAEWGGSVRNTGGLYDPETDTWTAMNTTNAPNNTFWPARAWTGKYFLTVGGKYDPETDTWTATSTVGSTGCERVELASVWTGTKLFLACDTQVIYDFVSDTWSNVSTVNAPNNRSWQYALWTGSRVWVWSGYISPSTYVNGGTPTNTGGLYDPNTDTWTTMTTLNAPPGAWAANTPVWIGSKVFVWGGSTAFGGSAVLTGGLYTPPVLSTNNTWTTMTTTGAPSPRYQPVEVWTGSKIIIWSGYNGNHFNDGGIYDPVTNSWTAVTTTGAPPPTRSAKGVWTGAKMFVWGGNGGNNGGNYDPNTNSWTGISSVGTPPQTNSVNMFWTGTKVIAWGGRDNALGDSNQGGIYNPANNTWTSITTTNTTQPNAKCVWTGSKMLCYGGGNYTGATKSYNPSTDTWTTLNSSAIGLLENSTLWTGSKMLTWGGHFGGIPQNSGGIYDLQTGTWSYMSTTNAPAPRGGHQAVWTGSEMIVWGGDGGTYLNTGGRYNPLTDTWKATTTTNAPSTRLYLDTVWTGAQMIIWGGAGSSFYNTGALYTP